MPIQITGKQGRQYPITGCVGIDRRGHTRIKRLLPATGAQAPEIARL